MSIPARIIICVIVGILCAIAILRAIAAIRYHSAVQNQISQTCGFNSAVVGGNISEAAGMIVACVIVFAFTVGLMANWDSIPWKTESASSTTSISADAPQHVVEPTEAFSYCGNCGNPVDTAYCRNCGSAQN